MAIALVGMHFRPPALAILSVLPAGCPLTATPEPTNPFDPNAIAVHVATSDIPESSHNQLAIESSGYGSSLEEILAAPSWHLGYIPAKLAAILAPKMKGEAQQGTLVFSLAGKPMIDLPLAEGIEEQN